MLEGKDGEADKLFRAEIEHEYHEDQTRGICQESKDEIKILYAEGVTRPMAILRHLELRGLVVPTKMQLSNYLIGVRKFFNQSK